MSDDDTVGEGLRARGISRRAFLKFCMAMTSFMALPPTVLTGLLVHYLTFGKAPALDAQG